MKILALVAGVVLVLLGGLWLVQGLGLVTIPPVLCVAECAPLKGPSTVWTITGAVAIVLGAAAIAYGLRRRPPASR